MLLSKSYSRHASKFGLNSMYFFKDIDFVKRKTPNIILLSLSCLSFRLDAVDLAVTRKRCIRYMHKVILTSKWRKEWKFYTLLDSCTTSHVCHCMILHFIYARPKKMYYETPSIVILFASNKIFPKWTCLKLGPSLIRWYTCRNINQVQVRVYY